MNKHHLRTVLDVCGWQVLDFRREMSLRRNWAVEMMSGDRAIPIAVVYASAWLLLRDGNTALPFDPETEGVAEVENLCRSRGWTRKAVMESIGRSKDHWQSLRKGESRLKQRDGWAMCWLRLYGPGDPFKSLDARVYGLRGADAAFDYRA